MDQASRGNSGADSISCHFMWDFFYGKRDIGAVLQPSPSINISSTFHILSFITDAV